MARAKNPRPTTPTCSGALAPLPEDPVAEAEPDAEPEREEPPEAEMPLVSKCTCEGWEKVLTGGRSSCGRRVRSSKRGSGRAAASRARRGRRSRRKGEEVGADARGLAAGIFLGLASGAIALRALCGTVGRRIHLSRAGAGNAHALGLAADVGGGTCFATC